MVLHVCRQPPARISTGRESWPPGRGCDLLKVRSVHWSSARDSIAGFWQDLCSSGMSWLSVLAGLHRYAPLLHIPSRAVKVCPTERHRSHAGQPLLAGCPV